MGVRIAARASALSVVAMLVAGCADADPGESGAPAVGAPTPAHSESVTAEPVGAFEEYWTPERLAELETAKMSFRPPPPPPNPAPASAPAPSPTPEPEPEPAAPGTVEGAVLTQVVMWDANDPDAGEEPEEFSPCEIPGAPVGAGTTVALEDGSGNVLGATSLQDGVILILPGPSGQRQGICVLPFELTGVPAADAYTFVVGDGDDLWTVDYGYDELGGHGWVALLKIDFSEDAA